MTVPFEVLVPAFLAELPCGQEEKLTEEEAEGEKGGGRLRPRGVDEVGRVERRKQAQRDRGRHW